MLSNIKTTLAGVAIAILNLIAHGQTVKNALMSVGFLVLGALSKDFNVTGGTKQQ